MRIGGIQKNSLIDFPQKISCVVFASGCNFDCPYCHNPELAMPPEDSCLLDAEAIVSFLKKRKSFLDGVVISGGEPTLQKELFNFCRQIKTIGYPVKLDTNGSNPQVIRQLIDQQLIDYIAMDVKTDPNRYAPLITKVMDPAAIRSSIRIIMDSGIAHEFRTTCVKPIVDETGIHTIAQLIQGADLFVLQKVQFHQNPVLHPEFFQNNGWQLDAQALEKFRSIAAEFVHACIVR
jgi:pyruvate formate lyase activating enzyme